MSNETPGTDIEVTSGSGILDSITSVAEAIETAVTGVPAPIRKNAQTAIARLCTAATAFPAAWLEGKTKELMAETDARILLTKTAAAQIAAQMEVDPDFALAASYKHAQKIVRLQKNTNSVGVQALESLRSEGPTDAPQSVPDISEDWLNAFEEEAAKMSSEQMQRLFGRILAGEIRKPSTFSIKTVRLMAQLDNRAAALFTVCCSLAISNVFPGMAAPQDARVVSMGSPGANSLQPYGLSFDSLNILQEYGLIISDYNSHMDYRTAVVRDGALAWPLTYQGLRYAFVPKGAPIPIQSPFQVNGVALTLSGRELLSIVDVEPNEAYTLAMTSFFDAQGMVLTRIG